jgi:hypothetical protein
MGSWTALPSMTTPRYGAVTASLSDGRVLVAGGIDGSGNATASAEIYDPSTNAWSSASAMGSARAFAAAAPLSDDQVLVAGGDVDGSPSASAEIYDATTDTWSPAAPMDSPVAGASAVTLSDGTVLVAGGANTMSGDTYDPAAEAWSSSDGGEYARDGGVAAPLGSGDVLLAGGFDPEDDRIAGAEIDAPASNYDTVIASLQGPEYEAAGASAGTGQVLAAGGSESESDPAPSASAEMYDQAAGAWGAVASMATARYGAVAAPLPDGDVLVAGGEGESGPLSSAEVFTPPAPAPLVNGTPPSIDDSSNPDSGVVSVGDILATTSGVWGNYVPDQSYTYEWQRCFSTCEDVSSTLMGPDYYVSDADVGATLRVVQTDSDGGYTDSSTSNELGPVAAPGYRLDSTGLLAELPTLESGQASEMQISVDRGDTTGLGAVSYRVWEPNPTAYPGFTPISGTLYYLPGQSQAEIDVPLADQGVPVVPSSLEVQLYNGYPFGESDPAQMTVSLSDDSPYDVRTPLNPLELANTPPGGNPLSGAKFFADYFQSLPGRTALAWSASYPSMAAKVEVIAREPNTERFGAWNGQDPGWGVWQYLTRAEGQDPGKVPMISTYRLVDGHCGHYSDPPAEQIAYHDWITSLAEGIGPHPAVLFLEMDSLITTGCLSPAGVTVRMNELRDAINALSNDPHLVVYLDAGAADALPAKRAASLLLRAGVAKIQGFFLNSTHFDWTKKEIAYGEKISRLTGGKHFVINTAENGQGPLRPRHPAKQGNEVLCDPPGRGLGPLPTAKTGYPNVDAFAWIANPGVSGGKCQPGAPPSGVFWPTLALQLVRHENFKVR